MAGAFPTTTKPRVFNFMSNRPNNTAYTLSGKRSVKQFSAQYFSFSVELPPMNQTDFMPFYSFLVKQKGSFESFTFQYPLNNLGSDKNATITVNGAHAIGDSTISLTGFTANTSGVLKAGDLLTFAGDTKVYMITADVDTGVAETTKTVSIEPPLQTALANTDAVVTNQPSFTVALAQDDVLYTTDASGFFSLSFDVREVL